jgi:hypothetical protein
MPQLQIKEISVDLYENTSKTIEVKYGDDYGECFR